MKYLITTIAALVLVGCGPSVPDISIHEAAFNGDIEAVKQSVKNLILTKHYERPFHPEIGSNVTDILFEPMTPLTALNLQRKVAEVLNNFEPRINLEQVLAKPDIDRNSYNLKIIFYVIGSNDPVEVETFLERLR